MPIYEYRCSSCGRVTNVFVRSAKVEATASCEHCGSDDLKRLMSRVGRVKSTQDVLQEYGTPTTGDEYRDPRQIGSWVEQRFQEYGMEVPAETREMIDRARDGDLPEGLDL